MTLWRVISLDCLVPARIEPATRLALMVTGLAYLYRKAIGGEILKAGTEALPAALAETPTSDDIKKDLPLLIS